MAEIQEYIARAREYGALRFDMIIADQMGKDWYDSSPQQSLPEREWCRQHIRNGDLVVDCGAHQGLMSLLFSFWAGDDGHVVAFEATRANAELMSRNAALNGRTNIEVHAKAVGADDAVHSYVSVGGTAVLGPAAGIHGDAVDQTETIRLDRALAGRVPDFVKIDVEGYEADVLRGAQASIASLPNLDLELHCLYFVDRRAYLEEILPLLPKEYLWYLQPEIFAQPEFVGRLDIDTLVKIDNPHIFGVRVEPHR